MKLSNRREFCCFILLAGLCLSASSLAEEVLFREETMVVSCVPGEEPGQYYCPGGEAYVFRPRCFAIDPNEGTFYIPEIDRHHNIRLHKFDPNGKLVKMLELEGDAAWVTSIAVSLNGDIYLMLAKHADYRSYIRHYSGEGKLLSRFGPKGPIMPEDLDAKKEAKKKQQINPIRDKYFDFSVGRIFLLENNQVLVLQDYFQTPDMYRFDGVTEELLEEVKKNRNLPTEIAQIKASHLEKFEAFYKWVRQQGRRPSCQYCVIGPDGEFYYMKVTLEKLEIRKVTFHENTPTPDATEEKGK